MRREFVSSAPPNYTVRFSPKANTSQIANEKLAVIAMKGNVSAKCDYYKVKRPGHLQILSSASGTRVESPNLHLFCPQQILILTEKRAAFKLTESDGISILNHSARLRLQR